MSEKQTRGHSLYTGRLLSAKTTILKALKHTGYRQLNMHQFVQLNLLQASRNVLEYLNKQIRSRSLLS